MKWDGKTWLFTELIFKFYLRIHVDRWQHLQVRQLTPRLIGMIKPSFWQFQFVWRQKGWREIVVPSWDFGRGNAKSESVGNMKSEGSATIEREIGSCIEIKRLAWLIIFCWVYVALLRHVELKAGDLRLKLEGIIYYFKLYYLLRLKLPMFTQQPAPSTLTGALA